MPFITKLDHIDLDLVRTLTGRKIENLRKARGLSQVAACEGAGMTRPNLNHIEKGSQGLTTFSCMALCLFYKVTPAELYPSFAELEAGAVSEVTTRRAVRAYKSKNA